MRHRVCAECARIRIRCAQLPTQRFLHLVVADEVAALAGEKTQQRHLVIGVRLERELTTMQPIRQQRLIQVRDLEWSREELGLLRTNRLDEETEDAIDLVHVTLRVKPR